MRPSIHLIPLSTSEVLRSPRADDDKCRGRTILCNIASFPQV
nr:MAG TPA: hypothetical protein [Caudoviricetes sp.]DAX42490.1 MAG TPA: hypothetical protein [Caudoviricetes sp.]